MSAISQFYILSPRGDTIISRDYRGDVARGTPEIFFRKVKFWEHGDAPPVFLNDGVSYIFVKKNGLYFVCTTKFNVSPNFTIELLGRLAKCFKDYCGILTEEAIRKNFILIYELLDEALDYGYPQSTSTESLKSFVYNEPVVVDLARTSASFKVPSMNQNKTTPSTSVHKPISLGDGKKGGKQRNEIFVDILERLTILFNSNGYVLNSEIDGCIQMKSYLSGNPGLRLALNEDMIVGKGNADNAYGALVLDDCNFHDCVQLDEFAESRVLSFVPPDGEFIVMNYRITGDFRAPFRIFPFVEEMSPTQVELIIKVRADIPEANYGSNVHVYFPVPKTTASVSLNYGTGGAGGTGAAVAGQSAEFRPRENRVVWSIQKFQGAAEHTLRAKITLKEPSTMSVRREMGPISMAFEIPMYNVSSLAVKYLRIAEKHKSNNPHRWVRYVTQSSSYVGRL